MGFGFYTFGGKRSWEDVFFYGQWRIQRHSTYKDYRLLDQYDICRHSGTFEQCYESFVEYAKALEMGKQKDHIIIMLHGLNGQKNDFAKMWQEMKNEDYTCALINYPSTKKNINSHVRQLNILIENLSDVNKISFVTKGIGGIVLRSLLATNSEWRKKIKIGRIVQIAPPNRGSRFLYMLSEYKIFRYFLGPILFEMNPKAAEQIPTFPKNVDFGIISCDFPMKKYSWILTKRIKENLPSQLENAINNDHKSIYIPNTCSNILENPRIISSVRSFIKNGSFK